MIYIQKNNITLLKSQNLDKLNWLGHSFTTRLGGISENYYTSLNLYSPEPDEFQKSLENRKILANELGFNSESLVLAQQIHGSNVHYVTNEETGKGAFSHKDAISETDALITNFTGIPLMLLYADCLPVLAVDKINRVIGVVHAGWKSTVLQILPKTLIKMKEEFNSKDENILIAFGIGIGKCCFEIGNEVKEKLEKVSFSTKSFEITKNKIYADLLEINISQALNFGIPEENLEYNRGLCTYCKDELFYSYRRDNSKTGRHGAVIYIK